MYENQQQYNGSLFYQEQPQSNLPPEQQFGGGIYQQQVPIQQVQQMQQVQQTPVQQVHVQPVQQPIQHVANGVQLITEQQAQQIMETIRPTPISNPVKIDRPAYLVTEEQMRYMLSLAEGKPLQTQQDAPFVEGNGMQRLPQLPSSSPKNTIDTLGEMTLGTVSRLGHTFTGLVNSVVDVLCMGYGKQNHR